MVNLSKISCSTADQLAEGFPRLVILLLLLTSTPIEAACPDADSPRSAIETDYFRVVTLNMAHGRMDGRNQILLKADVIRSNLDEVALGMNESGAHVIALQEADAASSWSGNFDHVAYLAEQSGFPCYFHGVHASGQFYDFGTALFSRLPFQGAFSHSFRPSWPTTTKGFVLAAVSWNPGGALEQPLAVKLGSIHLDFSRRSVRQSQMDEIVSALSGIEGPMVLMGDFNTDWQSEQSSLRHLADQLGLSVFQPHAEGLSTYGDKGARLDWILISSELAFQTYTIIPKVMSDHYAVAADLVLKEPTEAARSTRRRNTTTETGGR